MTIEEQVRAEYPFFALSEDTTRYTVGPEDFPAWYEELIAEKVVLRTAETAAATAEAAEETRRTQAKAAYDALKAGTATNAQVQKVVAFLLRERFRDLAP
jgi:predicted nucleic acid-binding protein